MSKKLVLAMFATFVLFIFVLFPSYALAHPGHSFGEESSRIHRMDTAFGFTEGLMHPVTGIDHLLMLIAVSLIALRWGGRWLINMPLAFLGFCIFGGVVAATGGSLPAIEAFVCGSVLAAGVVLYRNQNSSSFVLLCLAGLGVFHGGAHLNELSSGSSLVGYGIGLLVTSLGIILLTMGVAVPLTKMQRPTLMSGWKFAGSSIVVTNLIMMLV